MKPTAWLIVCSALLCAPAAALDPTPAGREATVAAPTVTPDPAPELDAVLWAQQAQEYRAVTRNVFSHARLRLDQALADPSWSASVEQIGMDRPFPRRTAIILDIDETVLNNSPLYARLVRDPTYPLGSGWASWTAQARARVLEGAVALIQYALSRDVHVFFVSNRGCTQDAATMANMAAVGFPVGDPRLVFLSRNTAYDDPGRPETPPCTAMEQYVAREFGITGPSWSGYKSGRRAAIATRYRILLQFGDSQGDFYSLVPAADAAADERKRLLLGHLTVAEREWIQKVWGAFFEDRWLPLPNAMYGNWLESINGYRPLGVADRVLLDASRLDTAEPADGR